MAGRHELRPEGPVFVDPSGRRSRVVRVIGWALAALLVSYLLLVAVALVGPPGLSRVNVPGVGPVLPGPGAAGLDAGGSEREAPRVVLERTPSTASPTRIRTASPVASAPGSAPGSAPAVAPTTPAATPSRPGGPGTTPTQAASPSATATSGRTGPANPQPARSEPPGATRRPTRSPS